MVRSMRWLTAARRWLPVACALVAAWLEPLGAQPAPYDTNVVSVRGSGQPTYVLITGMVGGVAGFRRLASLLEPTHRVVIIDPYRLAVDSTDVTFAALARYVDRVLGDLGIDSARVVGHGHGTGVALRLAAHAPNRVAALYFIEGGAVDENRTRTFSSSLKWASLIAKLPGGRGFVRGRYIRGLRQNAGREEWLDSATVYDYTEPILDHLPRAMRMARRLANAREPESYVSLVDKVHVPVSVLLGDVPHPAAPDSAELAVLARLGDRLRIERLPGVGHFPHEEAPVEVATYLLEGTVAAGWHTALPPSHTPAARSSPHR